MGAVAPHIHNAVEAEVDAEVLLSAAPEIWQFDSHESVPVDTSMHEAFAATWDANACCEHEPLEYTPVGQPYIAAPSNNASSGPPPGGEETIDLLYLDRDVKITQPEVVFVTDPVSGEVVPMATALMLVSSIQGKATARVLRVLFDSGGTGSMAHRRVCISLTHPSFLAMLFRSALSINRQKLEELDPNNEYVQTCELVSTKGCIIVHSDTMNEVLRTSNRPSQTDSTMGFVVEPTVEGANACITVSFCPLRNKYVMTQMAVLWGKSGNHYGQYFSHELRRYGYNDIGDFIDGYTGKVCDFCQGERLGFEIAIAQVFSVDLDEFDNLDRFTAIAKFIIVDHETELHGTLVSYRLVVKLSSFERLIHC